VLEADILERIDRCIRELEAIRGRGFGIRADGQRRRVRGADHQAPRGWSL
jgi:hypothetical protein